MFASRDRVKASSTIVDIAFTDRYGAPGTSPPHSLDLRRSPPEHDDELRANLDRVAHALDVTGFACMRQVHGAAVHAVTRPGIVPDACDALVTRTPGVALMVRVADCVPVVLADVEAGVVGVAHAGRRGLVAGVVPATVAMMHELGASTLDAWVGPHACGGCYEVPPSMRDDIAAHVPSCYACTTWGTPSLDLGAGVEAQLEKEDCTVHDRTRCTIESGDLFSHRREGEQAGRFAGIVVCRPDDDG